eukprot:COSAG01_NODE_37262_length_506_cov_0.410319_1_plen_94_part_00
MGRYYANCRTQEVQWEAPPLPPTANEALLSAAAAGDVAALVAACARGADVNVAVNAHGDAALAVASAYGHSTLVRTFVDRSSCAKAFADARRH